MLSSPDNPKTAIRCTVGKLKLPIVVPLHAELIGAAARVSRYLDLYVTDFNEDTVATLNLFGEENIDTFLARAFMAIDPKDKLAPFTNINHSPR